MEDLRRGYGSLLQREEKRGRRRGREEDKIKDNSRNIRKKKLNG